MDMILAGCFKHVRGPQFLFRRWVVATIGMIFLPVLVSAFLGIVAFGHFAPAELPVQLGLSVLGLLAGFILFPLVYYYAFSEIINWWPLNPDAGISGEILFCLPGAILATLFLFGLLLEKTPTPAQASVAAISATSFWATLIWWSTT